MDPIILKSGAKLAITLASFKAGNRLLKTIARELATVDFDLDLDALKDIGNKDVNTMKNVAFQVLQSEAIEREIFECAAKCLYNEERITDKTFDPEEARADYLPVAWEVMKANLRPFFKNLDLSLLAKGKALPADQTSE